MKNSIFKLANYDIIYLLITLIVFLLDILTRTDIIDTLALFLILLGFVILVINAVAHVKYENTRQINYLSGYLSFILILIILALFSLLNAYTSFSLLLADILRYITTLMFLTYITIYSILKRTIK